MHRPLLAAIASVALLCPLALAEVQDFTPIGPVDPLANGLSWDFANNQWHLFVTTEEGFYAWNQSTISWDDHTQPGWIGVARYGVTAVEGLPDRRVLGGVNAFFKGNLWLSEDQGETQDLIYESTGGRVMDLCRSRGYQQHLILACTWPDVAAGELLRSTNDGESWTPLVGHGHFAMTGVDIVADEEVYLAGDNYVSRSWDGGDTWENLQGDLPPGQGIYFVRAPELVTGLPIPRRDDRDSNASGIYVSNDTGVYFTYPGEIDWELILSEPCRAADERFVQIDTFVYWTETWVVTFDGRLLLTINRDWDDWEDVTDEIAPGQPIDVVTVTSVYVLTQEHGVYRSGGWNPTPAPVPDATMTLRAAPNPFNPRTVVSFELLTAGTIALEAFDLRGRQVARLANGHHEVGLHRAVWTGIANDGSALPSGTYLLRIRGEAGEVSETVTLVR